MYLFAPVAIEISGMFGKQTLSFLKDLACHVCKVSGEVKSFPYLLQRLTVAVQRGNAVSILSTLLAKIDLFWKTVTLINYSMYVFYVLFLLDLAHRC